MGKWLFEFIKTEETNTKTKVVIITLVIVFVGIVSLNLIDYFI